MVEKEALMLIKQEGINGRTEEAVSSQTMSTTGCKDPIVRNVMLNFLIELGATKLSCIPWMCDPEGALTCDAVWSD